jgi:hypothetical protein
METTNIRAHGSRDYWDRVALYARIHRTSIAALVKDAVDKTYGTRLLEVDPLFLPESVSKEKHISALEAENA